MRRSWNNDRGALTLVALCLTAVIGIALGSYIALCYQSLYHSTRQFNLNRARQLAESGIEEALWALNNNDWTSGGWGAALDADGDTLSDDHQNTFTATTVDSGVTGQVVVKVINFATNSPTIIATATITTPSNGTFTKTLTATTKTAPFFANAIGILNSNSGRVLFSSTSSTVDSWCSDPDGDYNVSSPRVDYTTPTYTLGTNCSAVIAAPNITLASATLYGYAVTYGNSISTSGSSKIKGPNAPASPNIDTSRIGKSAFVPDFPIAAPTGAYDSTTVHDLSGGSLDLGTPGATSPTYYSVGSDLTIDNSATLRINGPVVLKVTGSFQIYRASTVQVVSTGKLELFVTGDVYIGGIHGSTAKFQNDTNEAKNLAIYSTSTSSFRKFIYYSTADFCGVMYSAATGAKIEFDSGPNFYGAIVANYNVEFDTSVSFHYDTALRTLPANWFKGMTTSYLVQQITES
ncbi:MAG TPA: hypothetical protein VFJ90_01505 [Candidatus Didemnitutus sp.]|nr:hypothetical protein [Candidatus Didemnitutus sp.]